LIADTRPPWLAGQYDRDVAVMQCVYKYLAWVVFPHPSIPSNVIKRVSGFIQLKTEFFQKLGFSFHYLRRIFFRFSGNYGRLANVLDSGGKLVRAVVSSDKIQILHLRRPDGGQNGRLTRIGNRSGGSPRRLYVLYGVSFCKSALVKLPLKSSIP
jgi:hypothetical protein